MKLKGMIYEDKKGRMFFVRKESLPKKKGDYTFWVADEVQVNTNLLGGTSFREDMKSDLLKKIDESGL